MAYEPLNLSERLRPWHLAGIGSIFSPKAAKARQSPSEWDSPWREQWLKAQARPKQIWTYLELGQDLGPDPDSARRELWRSLLTKLSLPGGSVFFWPLSALSDAGLATNPPMFWTGVRKLNPAWVCVFGLSGFTALFKGAERVPGAQTLCGMNVLALEGPQELLANPESFNQALELLRKAQA